MSLLTRCRLVATRGYGAFNPSDLGTGYSLDASGLLLTRTAGGAYRHARGYPPQSAGKFYFESTITAGGTGGQRAVGIATTALGLNDGLELGQQANGCAVGAWLHDGSVRYGSASAVSHFLSANGVGDTICLAVDLDNGKFWVRTRSLAGAINAWNDSGDPSTNSGGISITQGAWMPAACLQATGMGISLNCGQSGFLAPLPNGFSGWSA